MNIKKRVLVTGSNGFLGQHLCKWLLQAGYYVIATGKGPARLPFTTHNYLPADLCISQQVEMLLQAANADIIIHTAAQSKPDECEKDKVFCEVANVASTRYLLQNFSGRIIYVSTDFIFGENGPHAEDAAPAPLNYYGATKLAAEQLVKQSGLNYAIVRPVFIYGPVWQGLRPSFLHWVKNKLTAGEPIKVVSDQMRTPTYVYDICKGIQAIIEGEHTGEYHLAGSDILSPYQMAVATAQHLSLDTSLIQNVTADTFPEPVKRAKYSGLIINKAINRLHYSPVSFEEGVRLTFADEN